MIVQQTPAQRAQSITGLRALATFLEDHPDIPAPQYIRGQHSVFGSDPATPDAEKIAAVRAVAAQLGVEARLDSSLVRVEYAVAPNTTYVVAANLRGDEAVTGR
jgi:hypothetical protein